MAAKSLVAMGMHRRWRNCWRNLIQAAGCQAILTADPPKIVLNDQDAVVPAGTQIIADEPTKLSVKPPDHDFAVLVGPDPSTMQAGQATIRNAMPSVLLSLGWAYLTGD